MFEKIKIDEKKDIENLENSVKPIESSSSNIPIKINTITKITEEQKQKYLEDAGKTTILREIARNLKRIKRNLDIILLILTIFFAIITGVFLGYREYIISIVPAIVTFVFAIITYTLPAGDLKTAVDNFQDTLIKRK